ncbi:MAG: gliding motility-associated C-terminal domain-containing protein [Bacteroidota bacterium]
MKLNYIKFLLGSLMILTQLRSQSCFIAPTSTFNCSLNLATTNFSISFATGPYTVMVTNPSNTSTLATIVTGANSGTLANLPVGNYNVILLTSACSFTNPYTVVNPYTSSGAILTSTQVTCFGTNNGQAIILPSSNFTPPISYTWSNGSSAQSSGPIGAGNHTISFTDALSCGYTTSFSISQPSLISSITNNTFITCFGGTTSAVLTSTGGLSPYTYTVNGIPAMGSTANNISAGVATITTRDSYSCVVNNTINIIQPPQPIINSSITPATCPGKTDASATVAVSNAPAPYTYTWNPNGSVTSSQISNVAPGIYTITVKDGSACVTKSLVTITSLNALTVTPITQSENCSAADGAATIQVTGGSAPYQYTLFPIGSTGNTISNLSSGIYTLVVKDLNNCKDSSNLFIGNLSTVSVSVINFTPVLCYNNCNGAVNLNVQNAVPPITYSVSGTSTTNLNPVGNLCAGFKIIKVIDGLGCPATTTLNLTQPAVYSFSASSPQNICIGQSTSIQGFAQGGAGNYTYQWQPGNLVGPVISVNPNVTTAYSLNVYDANGCTLPAYVVTVNVNPMIQININSSNSGICPGTTAQISPTITGGNGNYNYNWLPGNQTTPSIFVENISIPTFTLEVTDGCGSPKAIKIININLHPKIIPTFNVSSQSGCETFCTEFINTTLKSSNAIWNFGDRPSEMTGNKVIYCYNNAGLYNVKLSVTDSNNCKTSFTYTSHINVHPKPVISIATEPKRLTLLNAENVTFLAEGDAQNYFWLNEMNQLISTKSIFFTRFSEVECKKYILIGISSNNCRDTVNKTICVEEPLTVWVPNAITPNNDNLNDVLKPTGTGWQVGSYSFEVFNRWGQRIFKTSNPDEGWTADGSSDDSNMRNVYYWKLKVNSSIDGSENNFKGHVIVIR